MPLHPRTPTSLASFKSRLVLPFWYRLSRVVPDKGALNGCVCVCGCCCELLSETLQICSVRGRWADADCLLSVPHGTSAPDGVPRCFAAAAAARPPRHRARHLAACRREFLQLDAIIIITTTIIKRRLISRRNMPGDITRARYTN